MNDNDVRTARSQKKTIITAAVLLLIACLAWMAYDWNTQRHKALPGEVILKGEVRRLKDVVNQYYEGVNVCGYTTEYSYLTDDQSAGNGSLQIVHVFKDTETSNMDNPGEICKAVVEGLTKSIGKEPEEGKDGFGTGRYWFWTLKANTEAVLLYMGNENLMLTYVYRK